MKRIAIMIAAALLITSSALAGEWWIPAAAHADGAEGSVWRTDLLIHNFGVVDDTAAITLLPQGTDNSSLDITAAVAVPAGDSVVISDVATTLFTFGGNAALRIGAAGDQLVVTSRTYNQSVTGTYGQSIPAVNGAAAVAPDERVILMGLAGTDGRRTNVGWVSLEPSAITVVVELIAGSGELLQSQVFGVPPYGQMQLNDVFATLGTSAVGNAWARVWSNGRFIPYASVVAGGSNDPIYVAAQRALDRGTTLLFPATVHAPGAEGTSWRTDGWFLNTSLLEADLRIELWFQGQANSSVEQHRLTLAPGQQLELEDLVLNTLGHDNAQGALVMRSDQLLLATSRTYNTADSGTFGQFIQARTFTSLAGIGETQLLTGAVHNSSFRTNLGLVSTASLTQVQLALRAMDGEQLATATVDLDHNEQYQQSLGTIFGVTGFSGATVEVTMSSAGIDEAVLAAYLSVIDNRSSDPTYAVAARGISAEADLQKVNQTVITTTYALGVAADNSGPRVLGGKTAQQCVTVDYSGDTLLPGQSPEGKCWLADLTFDECFYELPGTTWSITQNGTAGADVCIIDDYPSALTANLTTEIVDSATGEDFLYAMEALLGMTLSFDASRPESLHLDGFVDLDVDGSDIQGWADLLWEAGLGGFEMIPAGVLGLTFPYATDTGTTIAEVTSTFDGSAWAYIQIRLGYWYTAFYLNLYTGEMSLTHP